MAVVNGCRPKLTAGILLCYTLAAMRLVAQPPAMTVVEPIDLRPTIESVLMTFTQTTSPAVLESSFHHESYGRFSIFACDPVDEFILPAGSPDCPFRGLARQAAGYPRVTGGDVPVPFVGGWIGYFAYEAGLAGEQIACPAAPEVKVPWAWFRLYDTAAVHDHRTGQWYLTAVDWPAAILPQRPPCSVRLASLRERLAFAVDLKPAEPPAPDASKPTPNMSREAYFAKVNRAKRYIEAGDIYQVNLTQRFTARTNTAPLDLYRRLRRVSPSSHAALLPWGQVAILSSSPELFLELCEGHVITRPIKGTRPRVGHLLIDAANRRELAQSEKERAELTMIIDLLRNDLGRVCSFGSVRVTDAGIIEWPPSRVICESVTRGSTCSGLRSPAGRSPGPRKYGQWRSSPNSNRPPGGSTAARSDTWALTAVCRSTSP